MTPTNEQIIAEAERRWAESTMSSRSNKTAKDFIIEVMRENWTPPEPVVDPDILAFREWAAARSPVNAGAIHKGLYDEESAGFLAGARMAREQERERAKGLVDNLDNLVRRVAADWAQDDVTDINASEMSAACAILAKYRGEA